MGLPEHETFCPNSERVASKMNSGRLEKNWNIASGLVKDLQNNLWIASHTHTHTHRQLDVGGQILRSG